MPLGDGVIVVRLRIRAGTSSMIRQAIQNTIENVALAPSADGWVRAERWNASEAALGSSYYVLRAPLSWFTANIGVHHVHHLSSRIPYYRLRTSPTRQAWRCGAWVSTMRAIIMPRLSGSGYCNPDEGSRCIS